MSESDNMEAAVEKDAKYLEQECSEGLYLNPKVAAALQVLHAQKEANRAMKEADRAMDVYRNASSQPPL